MNVRASRSHNFQLVLTDAEQAKLQRVYGDIPAKTQKFADRHMFGARVRRVPGAAVRRIRRTALSLTSRAATKMFGTKRKR